MGVVTVRLVRHPLWRPEVHPTGHWLAGLIVKGEGYGLVWNAKAVEKYRM